MKKWLALLLVVLSLVTLTACGGDKDAETNAKSILNAAEADCSSEDEPVSVSIKKSACSKRRRRITRNTAISWSRPIPMTGVMRSFAKAR